MEHLTKQQIVLLTLLVSFVTSLATGIFTVTLMDQAPQGVTRTITQVVEKTIEKAIAPSQDAAVGSADPAVAAITAVSQSVVRIRNRSNGAVTGLGIVLSSDGVIVSDKSVVAQASDPEALLSNGATVPIFAVQSQNDGDIVFLAPRTLVPNITFVPAAFSGLPALGGTVFTFVGTSTGAIGQGIATSISSDKLGTSVLTAGLLIGTPLFNLKKEIVGIHTSAFANDPTASFYPLSLIIPAIPKLGHN